MSTDLDHLTAGQWQALARLSAEAAHLGTLLRERWAGHPCARYLGDRLALPCAIDMAREEDDLEPVDLPVLYARLFGASAAGTKARADFGFAARVEKHHQALIETAAEIGAFPEPKRLPPALRAQGASRIPLPIRAINRSREAAARFVPEAEAAIETQRMMARAAMFPGQALPIGFAVPRLRTDGDWLIGALRRFAAALDGAIDLLDACDAYLARGAEILGETRAHATARVALPLLAGKPCLRQDHVGAGLGVSKKSAIGALATLTEAGLAREITGLQKFQAYVAEDPVLGLEIPEPGEPFPLSGGLRARPA